jgi:hypothetical protein
MPEHRENHPLASVPGVLALAAWSAYVLCALLYFLPDLQPTELVNGCFGIAACLALAFNFKYWRATALAAASLYLVLYAIRVFRMTAMTPDLPFTSALSFYYTMSWQVSVGAFQEKGMAAGLAYAFLQYAMPVLMVALIAAILIFRRSRPGAAQAG